MQLSSVIIHLPRYIKVNRYIRNYEHLDQYNEIYFHIVHVYYVLFRILMICDNTILALLIGTMPF